jgi:hypothetical protein
MEKVTGIIERHLSDADVDVAMSSREAGVERSRLFRRARDLYGLAPSDLIRSMRVGAGAASSSPSRAPSDLRTPLASTASRTSAVVFTRRTA